jgi:hypothetical protein
VPGAVSDGTGFFSYTVSGSELCYTLEVRDLTGDPVAAHIHMPRATWPGPSLYRWRLPRPRAAPSATASPQPKVAR